jgi:hypothetical protein
MKVEVNSEVSNTLSSDISRRGMATILIEQWKHRPASKYDRYRQGAEEDRKIKPTRSA